MELLHCFKPSCILEFCKVSEQCLSSPMSELADLLAGIQANPHDDARLLILSDWLEERGQEARAELIRLQVRLSHWIPDHVERESWQARERALLEQHRKDW